MFWNKYKATKEHEGQTRFVLWNPQGFREMGEKPVYRKGTIQNVDPEGNFELQLENSGIMMCRDLKNLKTSI